MKELFESEEQVREYVTKCFRETLDEYVGRPLTPITIENVRASIERTARKVITDPFVVDVKLSETEPNAFDVTISSPPCIVMDFYIKNDENAVLNSDETPNQTRADSRTDSPQSQAPLFALLEGAFFARSTRSVGRGA